MMRLGSAVQTKGVGLRLCSPRYRLIAACRSTSERKTPRCKRRRVSVAKKLSTALAQEHDRVVKLTLAEPLGAATHWTGRAMAAASGISLRSVQRIWAAHGLQPHRVRRFKLSQDPAFAAKLRDVVGLYLDPPAHSL